MSIALGMIQLTVGANSFQATQGGILGFVIGNVSGLSVTVKLDGTGFSKDLYPGTVDFFPVGSGFTGTILLQATGDLHNVSSFAGNYVRVTAIGLREAFNAGAYPMQLPALAVSTSGSGRPNFSASLSIASTAGTIQHLNVFNPGNSGVNYNFYAARVTTNDTAIPKATISYFVGNDLNYASGVVGVVGHNAVTGAISAANSTYSDGAVAGSGNIVEQFSMNINDIPEDFLTFPDSVSIPPGTNFTINLIAGANGKSISLTSKWTESPV